MSWAVGNRGQRHIGYGVPAICDHPGCGEAIDRGIAYACGGGRIDACGLFFCANHLTAFVEDDDDSGEWVCSQCALDLPPFDPTSDTHEWAEHVLTDDSWAQWRAEEPEWADRMRAIVNEAS